MRSVKAVTVRRVDPGELNYPAPGNFNPDRGAAHLWITVDFDTRAGGPAQSQYNQSLFHVSWLDDSWLGFYWNIDDRGMRAYVSTMSGGGRQFPVLIPSYSPEWTRGERHVVTLSWGDEFAIFVDGQRKIGVPYKGTLRSPPRRRAARLRRNRFNRPRDQGHRRALLRRRSAGAHRR